MAKTPKFKVETILEAIKDTGGLKTEVCNKLKCGRRTIYNYIEKHPEIKAAFEEEEEKVLDMAEGNLFAMIQNGDLSAIFYYLNNKGKKRGYGYYKDKQPDNATEQKEERKTGVLVTPGLFTEEAWTQEAAKK